MHFGTIAASVVANLVTLKGNKWKQGGLKHITVESNERCDCGGGSREGLFEDRCGDMLGQSRPQ